MSLYEAWSDVLANDGEPPKTCSAFQATIFIAGDLSKIRDVCRRYCLNKLCVTITPTEFIYVGGSETGAAIGLIDYPRFPEGSTEIMRRSGELAKILMYECCQKSCTIASSVGTEFLQNPDLQVR